MRRLLLFMSLVTFNAFSQSNENRDLSEFPQRLLVHYCHDELLDMKMNASEKYQEVYYYHMESYVVEKYEIEQPLSIDLDKFDISIYERFRKKSETVVKYNWKKGFKVTLIPIDDLEFILPIHVQPIDQISDEDFE